MLHCIKCHCISICALIQASSKCFCDELWAAVYFNQALSSSLKVRGTWKTLVPNHGQSDLCWERWSWEMKELYKPTEGYVNTAACELAVCCECSWCKMILLLTNDNWRLLIKSGTCAWLVEVSLSGVWHWLCQRISDRDEPVLFPSSVFGFISFLIFYLYE